VFGYVKAYKPELRIKEFEFYKAVYCSLCRDLGKKYGLVSRFSLSYDFTFLSLLHMSLRGGPAPTERKACVCNPLKKCNFLCSGELPEMPTAAAEIMLYSKLNDNIAGFLLIFVSCFRLHMNCNHEEIRIISRGAVKIDGGGAGNSVFRLHFLKLVLIV